MNLTAFATNLILKSHPNLSYYYGQQFFFCKLIVIACSNELSAVLGSDIKGLVTKGNEHAAAHSMNTQLHAMAYAFLVMSSRVFDFVIFCKIE